MLTLDSVRDGLLDKVLASLQVLSLPTRTNFRSVTKREVALFEGPFGWGEFSPFLEYGPKESANWFASGIEAAFEPPIALLREEIEINATLPAVDSKEDVRKILSWYPGARVVKIKVGGELASDLARIRHTLAVNPEFKIRLDVNGAWSVQECQSAIQQIINEFGIERFEYVEQPVATLDELRQLQLSIPVAGDEVIRKSADPFAIDLSGAVDILMLKVAPLGGVKRAMAIAAHHGLPVVVSSALESAVGISHGIRLAAALPELKFSCGLATGRLLEKDVAQIPIADGKVKVSDVKSLNPSGLSNYQAAPDRIKWWQARVRESFAVWQAQS